MDTGYWIVLVLIFDFSLLLSHFLSFHFSFSFSLSFSFSFSLHSFHLRSISGEWWSCTARDSIQYSYVYRGNILKWRRQLINITEFISSLFFLSLLLLHIFRSKTRWAHRINYLIQNYACKFGLTIPFGNILSFWMCSSAFVPFDLFVRMAEHMHHLIRLIPLEYLWS